MLLLTYYIEGNTFYQSSSGTDKIESLFIS